MSPLFNVPPARRRGSALVEFALVVGVLLALVMGIIEFSAYSKNSLTIANATREGARAASIGNTTAQIRDRVTRFTAPLPVASPNGSITLEYSVDKGETYQSLTDNSSGTQNGAPADSLVRVRVTTLNRSITGAFGVLFNRQIQTLVTMRRETSVTS